MRLDAGAGWSYLREAPLNLPIPKCLGIVSGVGQGSRRMTYERKPAFELYEAIKIPAPKQRPRKTTDEELKACKQELGRRVGVSNTGKPSHHPPMKRAIWAKWASQAQKCRIYYPADHPARTWQEEREAALASIDPATLPPRRRAPKT